MAERTAKRTLLAAVLWILILGLLAVAWRFSVQPLLARWMQGATGSESLYRHQLGLALDSFSGYCVLRSEPFRDELKRRGVKLLLQDDAADYDARMRALRDGDAQMAVFTVDSLVAASARLGDFPATIVLVIDESRGADAIVARGDAVQSIQDLDHPEARLVLTPDSPSEFLARVVLAHFNLPRLPRDWVVAADGPQEVLRRLAAAGPADRRAYVLWEPQLSRALAGGARVLLDSSRLKGYIVDVLAVRRRFLLDEPEVVRGVLESYLRVAYGYQQRPGGLAQLLREDALAAGSEALDVEALRRLTEGIRWKNTLENYGHFGLLGAAAAPGAQGLQHLEDIIENVAQVQVTTGALPQDPLRGKASTLFYDRCLAELKEAGFHPGKGLALMEGVGPGLMDLDAVQADDDLQALSDEQWERLVSVGEMRVESIAFARGTARINLASRRELGRLAELLHAWPRYYLQVVGHARAQGDPEANRRLAVERAQAAVDELLSLGLDPRRIRARAAPPAGSGGQAQSVSFMLGQMPY